MPPLLYTSLLWVAAGFQPKESSHCLQWDEVQPTRLRIEGDVEAPVIGKASGHWGYVAKNGSFVFLGGDLPKPLGGERRFPRIHPDCEVWWREVSEDVIPPAPELSLPVWQDDETMTVTAKSSLVGLCYSSSLQSVGHIPLEGPEMGACHLAEGEPRVLVGGLFHLLQARPLAAPCAEEDGPQLLDALRWRIERFLAPDDRELLASVVNSSNVFPRLLQGLEQLDACQLREVLSSSRFVVHELNALGLHLLRSLLAERMADARALARGYTSHPDFAIWRRDGLLIKDLDSPALGDEAVRDLLRMVSGEDSLGIPEVLAWQPRNVTVQAVPDPQQQFHIDTFQSIVKVWVFKDPPGVSLSQGPLLFSRRSHRNSEAKLRWMQAYAHPPSSEARQEPSFRLRGCAAATDAAWDFVQAVEGKIHLEAAAAATPVLPLPRTRTLVLADTSALHARGTGVPGEVRQSWRLKGDNDGGLKRLNPYRLEFYESREEL